MIKRSLFMGCHTQAIFTQSASKLFIGRRFFNRSRRCLCLEKRSLLRQHTTAAFSLSRYQGFHNRNRLELKLYKEDNSICGTQDEQHCIPYTTDRVVGNQTSNKSIGVELYRERTS